MKHRLVQLLLLALVATIAITCSKSDNGPSGPSTPADTTSPYVTGISPDSNNFNVTPTAHLLVTVSEDLNATSVTRSSVVLSGGGADTVTTTLSVLGNVITVTPTASLLNAGLYQLDITQAVEDKAGNALRESMRMTFGIEPYTATASGAWVRRIRSGYMSPDVSLSSVIVKQDGSIAVAGAADDGMYTAALSATGEVSWIRKSYATTGAALVSSDLFERQDGFLVGCATSGLSPNAGLVYGALQLGTPAFNYSYTGQSWAQLHSIIQTASYGAAGCGVAGAPGAKAYLVKTTPYGGPVWQRYLGTGECRGHGLVAAGTGFLLCGSQGVSPATGLVIKTNDTGVTVWEHTYGPASFEDIVSLTGGLFAIAGTTSANHIVVVAIDSSGTEQWRTDIGAGTGHALAALTDGGCVVTGEASGKVVLAKLSSSGVLTWRRDLIDGSGHSVAVAADGYVIAVGPRVFTTDKTYVMKTDLSGNL